MLSKLAVATALLASFISPSSAERNVWSKSVDGVGASIVMKDDSAITTGFSAKFYDYPWGDFIPFWCDHWVAGGYSTNDIRTTASAVTSPNFSFSPGNKNLYGLYNIDMTNVLVELKGYFARMYIHFIVKTNDLHFSSNTNIIFCFFFIILFYYSNN